MTDYLVDNAVLARLASGDARIAARGCGASSARRRPLRDLRAAVCHSARTADEHARYREQISLGFPLEHAPDGSLVLDIQSALWNAGLVRAAGSLAVLIGGYAMVNDATVLAADHDFDHIARVIDLKHEYLAPSS